MLCPKHLRWYAIIGLELICKYKYLIGFVTIGIKLCNLQGMVARITAQETCISFRKVGNSRCDVTYT
jgi:hypothetical protein